MYMLVETGRETQSTLGVALQASWEITLYFTPFLVLRNNPLQPHWHPCYLSTHFSPADAQLYNYLDTADIFVSNCPLQARLASVEGNAPSSHSPSGSCNSFLMSWIPLDSTRITKRKYLVNFANRKNIMVLQRFINWTLHGLNHLNELRQSS